MSKPNILVTGGAGYIGSHICKNLAIEGFIPVTLDNLKNGFETLVKWGPLEVGDINDKIWLEEIFAKYSPLAVIHCAGLISVEESVRNPDIYFHNNLQATKTLLEVMQQAGIKHMIYSGTASVYGNTTHDTINEHHPCDPQNPYAESKFQAENLIRRYAEEHKLSAMILRYFNAAGSDAEGETGEMHDPETHLIPLAIKAALGGTPFTIYGDGSVIRDYVHVSDLAQAHVLALRHCLSHNDTQIFNVGCGKGFSVNEVVKMVEELSGITLSLHNGASRPGDVPMLVADIGKAHRILGYTPEHSSLSNIITTALTWHRKHTHHPAS